MLHTEESVLDVTKLEPRQKHPTIFSRFDALTPGKSLTIHNDHDPKPLYYQLLGERGNTFTWQYLQEGPEWWDVKITKRNMEENDEQVGQIAAKDFRKAQVFRKYGIDFCCGGKKTLKQTCAEKGLDVLAIEKELEATDRVDSVRNLPYQDWSPAFLADYIVNTHHSYVRKNLPDMLQFSKKVAAVHGSEHPELKRVAELVNQVNDELITHMAKEEQVLFPFIRKLSEGEQNVLNLSINGPIHVMEMDHDLVGELMRELRSITNEYLLPQDACASYTYLFRQLQEFEEDLHLHIHLENNILFPKALELAQK